MSTEAVSPLPEVLRRKHLKDATGLSPSTVYRMIARKEFPAPVQLSTQAVGWLRSEIDAWRAARAESRLEAQS
ncbi:AlpA family phage regulatory protein [Variovorax paradoxus]|uniref:AlpA family phage regulatory protein n=1 Tax=Variovorax paradoxus TaxID=34073 RepID=A0A5Q0M5D8_VARPD|nr:AlpA family phage regulatory protein [Variovorax paradoxus]QFZ84656.1 AlpA family phage regulatory protein [Variovorax paradoxus]